ncbi:MAG TPA: ATP-binding protein [Candidatus Binatia bacterium]
MQNPFKFGSIVTGNDFADRRREQAELAKELGDGQHLFLLSPRRFGKTSLIFTLLGVLRSQGMLVAYLDAFRTASPVQFLELMAQTSLRAVESRPERLLRLAMDLLGRLRPQVGSDSQGQPTLTLDVGTTARSILALQEEVLSLPQRLAEKRKKRLVLCFDEFQEIQRFPGGALEKTMRSHFQQHSRVSYLFAGSKESALREMATRERSPFYKFGRMVSLGPIPQEEFLPFLEARFKRGRLSVPTEVLEAVLTAADDVPYNVQRLCHQLWADSAGNVKRITEKDIGTALASIVAQDTAYFSAIWDGLSLHQRQVLQAITRAGGRNVFASEFLAAHRLGSHSSMQTSLRQLLKEQIVFKVDREYRLADAFFREWVSSRLP